MKEVSYEAAHPSEVPKKPCEERKAVILQWFKFFVSEDIVMADLEFFTIYSHGRSNLKVRCDVCPDWLHWERENTYVRDARKGRDFMDHTIIGFRDDLKLMLWQIDSCELWFQWVKIVQPEELREKILPNVRGRVLLGVSLPNKREGTLYLTPSIETEANGIDVPKIRRLIEVRLGDDEREDDRPKLIFRIDPDEVIDNLTKLEAIARVANKLGKE